MLHRKIKYRFVLLLLAIFRGLEGRLGYYIRGQLYGSVCKSFGKNVLVGPYVFIFMPEKLSIGNNVSIHEFTLISCNGGVTIGNDVSVAHNCSFLSTSHIYDDASVNIRDAGVTYDPIVLADNIWIGCGVRVLSGATIKSGVVVAANSVVNGTLFKETVYGGIPARKIKPRTL
jgi:acetyltransferase-like isoleucine patch superfamily enzyme